jgi:hypothetical protein
MAGSSLSDDCEVAVVGAGPYGLAAAAHLRAAGIDSRTFGRPLSFWREHMPDSMRLRSPWIATGIADPDKRFSLDVFAREAGLPPQDQLPIERFRQYGDWFQRQAVPDLDQRRVLRVERAVSGFRLVLDDQSMVAARRVVVALGLANQELRPQPFRDVPRRLASHTSEHTRLDKWVGKRVAVLGRGQSACESAALLSEAGSEVDLVCQGDIRFIGRVESAAIHDWRWALRERLQAPSAVGPFPLSWANELPGLERLLPNALRAAISSRSLRAACASWVMPRLVDVRVVSGRAITGVREQGRGLTLELDDGVRDYDHVLMGTGYRIDIGKLGILSADLMQRIACRSGAPVLGRGCESSVAGLHFVGASAVASVGPLMRFIAGSGYAARSVTRRALADRRFARAPRQHEARAAAVNQSELRIPAE